MALSYFYWISTFLISLLYLSSAFLYVTKRTWVRQTLAELNYPAPYLVPLMVVVKILGVAVIFLRPGPLLSDLAYAGIFYHLLLSGSAYLGVAKPKGAVPALIGIMLLAVSFTTQNSARAEQSPYAPHFLAQPE